MLISEIFSYLDGLEYLCFSKDEELIVLNTRNKVPVNIVI